LIYSVSQNILPPWGFLKYFFSDFEFLSKILHACSLYVHTKFYFIISSFDKVTPY